MAVPQLCLRVTRESWRILQGSHKQGDSRRQDDGGRDDSLEDDEGARNAAHCLHDAAKLSIENSFAKNVHKKDSCSKSVTKVLLKGKSDQT